LKQAKKGNMVAHNQSRYYSQARTSSGMFLKKRQVPSIRPSCPVHYFWQFFFVNL
jgi:hypothetical protein